MKKWISEIKYFLYPAFIMMLLAVIVLVCAVLLPCHPRKTLTNEELVVDWVLGAPKPIRVFTYGEKADGSYEYVLVDSLEGVYNTGKVYIELPKIIK